jgi:4-aminobutyrate aminotransferase
MQAVELVLDRETKAPAPVETRKLMDAARRGGLLIGRGGLYGNVIRISPPMNIGRSDVDEFIRLLDSAFAEVVR